MAATQRFKRLIAAGIAWGLLFTPARVFAAIPGTGEMDGYFRVIWGLLVVLGIILILYGLLKKRFSLLSTSPQQQIKILEIKPLMGKKALCLVEVRGQEYLIGISGDQISPIAPIANKTTASFADTLKQSEAGPAL